MPPKKKTKKTTKKNPEKSNVAHAINQFLDFVLLNYDVFLTDVIAWWVAGENDLEAKCRRNILDIAVLQDHVGEHQF